MKHTFTIENAYNFAWEKMKKYWASFLLIGVVTFLIQGLFSLLEMASLGGFTNYMSMQSSTQDNFDVSVASMGAYWTIVILGMLVSLWIGYNATKMFLKMTDNKEVNLSELFHWDNKTLNNLGMYFISSLVLLLVVMVGLVLFIIPGIYFGLKYMFVPYLVIDKNISIEAAFKKSAEMTSGNMLKLIGFALVSFAVVMVGVLALIVGVIPAMILTTFAGFYVYRKLADGHVVGEHGHKAEEVKEV